jgi:hypothetical protein
MTELSYVTKIKELMSDILTDVKLNLNLLNSEF